MKAEMEEFEKYAEEALENHAAELHTKYENRSPGSDEMMIKAYEAHRKMLSQELEQKIDAFFTDRDPWMKQRALEIKQQCLGNLVYSSSS